MEVDQIQYFQIISDDQQNENNIIYVAYNNDELDVDDSQTSKNLTVKEEENETTCNDKSTTKREPSDLEVVTLSDGSTAYICRDILDINEFLETGIEDEIQNNFENLHPDTEAHPEILEDDKHYQQVQLEDGSIAILEVKVLNTNPELSESARNEFEEVPNDFKSISGSKKKKIYLCVYEGCNKVYTTHHHLKVHHRTHTGYRPYKCSEVGCEKFFTTKSSLKSHFRTHSNEKPYSCSTCPKSFKTSSDLQKHVRTHTGERPFRCLMDGCSMSFTTSNIRKVHMRTHTGERPFQCPEPNCNKAFASHTNYKNHLRVHSGEKPFVCKEPMCQKRFTEYSSLYKHQVVHRKNIEHACKVCYKTYRQLTTLKTHMRVVHGINIKNEDTSTALSTNEKEVPVSLVQVTSDAEFNNLSQIKIKDISNNQSIVNFENDQKYDLVFMLQPQ